MAFDEFFNNYICELKLEYKKTRKTYVFVVFRVLLLWLLFLRDRLLYFWQPYSACVVSLHSSKKYKTATFARWLIRTPCWQTTLSSIHYRYPSRLYLLNISYKLMVSACPGTLPQWMWTRPCPRSHCEARSTSHTVCGWKQTTNSSKGIVQTKHQTQTCSLHFRLYKLM